VAWLVETNVVSPHGSHLLSLSVSLLDVMCVTHGDSVYHTYMCSGTNSGNYVYLYRFPWLPLAAHNEGAVLNIMYPDTLSNSQIEVLIFQFSVNPDF